MLDTARQRAVIEAQIREWEDVAFSAEIAHKVHTRLKSDKSVLAGFVERATQAEHAIDELKKMLAELPPAPDTNQT